MTYRIEIKILSRPENGMGFGFAVDAGTGMVFTVAKTFGTPAGADVIAPGGTANTAASALLANLIANDAVAGVVYSQSGTSVYADITSVNEIKVTGLYGAPDFISVYPQDPEIMGYRDMWLTGVSIEIIDTYDNDRPLIEEFTQPTTVKLVWDGGDDLYQPMMPSQLNFTMAVTDKADAKFLHLLTGDEMRYLVKVKDRSASPENTLLIWQGYLLPDLYSEPWKSGVSFVSFTAIDMLASLKTKTFKPWYYRQTYSVPELLGLILKETGLVQEMYIRPMMINTLAADFQWKDTNINLQTFRDDKKLSDLYDILEKVLTAQGLVIYSLRGKWIIEGLTRRGEGGTSFSRNPIVEIYHPDGVLKEKKGLGHKVAAPRFSAGTVSVIPETPWKRATMNFEAQADEGLFPEAVGGVDYFSTRYRYDTDFADYEYGFVTNLNGAWLPSGDVSEFDYSTGNLPFFNYGINSQTGYHSDDALALTKSFNCTVKPYAVAGRRYKIEISVYVIFRLVLELPYSVSAFTQRMADGQWDSLINFVLKVGGEEFISNRPGNVINKLVQFEKTVSSAQYYNAADFKLEYEFIMPRSGFLDFSFIAPIGSFTDMFLRGFYARVDTLKITLVKNPSETESVSAVRDINYTKEVEADLAFTSSVDSSIKNSFGIGRRIGWRFYEVPVIDLTQIYDTHYQVLHQDPFDPIDGTHDPDGTIIAATLELSQWKISAFVRDLLFKAGGNYSLFMVKVDGTSIEYPSVYVKEYLGQAYLAAYNGYIPPPPGFTQPNVPETYPELPVPGPGDKFYIMLSLYPVEDKNLRAKWKIYGTDDATGDVYINTLAKAYHMVRPDVCYGMEATALDLITPDKLIGFRYDNANRLFIPTRLELDITEGKTAVTMKEAKRTNVNDITYE